MTEKRPIAIGLGELLWDMLPDGKQLGGAPFNFARHCAQLGLDAFPVSRVGNDALGDETIALLDQWDIDSQYVSRDPNHETGTVQVRLDSEGKPAYEIRERAAWDFLEMTEFLEDLASKVDAVCFGTLAQRSLASQTAIYGILDCMRPDAIKLFDINLRQSYYSDEAIEASLQRANLLKLSDEELPALKGVFSLSGSVEKQLFELKNRFELRLIAYTRGGDGSVLLDDSGLDEHSGAPASKKDTIGAGDSFAATLCVGLISGLPLAQINENANRVAAYVCSKQGATPDLPEEIVDSARLASRSHL